MNNAQIPPMSANEIRFLPADARFVLDILERLGNPEEKSEMVKVNSFQFLSVVFPSKSDADAFREDWADF
jgi:hypothetical protein